MGFVASYRHALRMWPICTKSATSVVLFGVGNAGAQAVEWRRQNDAHTRELSVRNTTNMPGSVYGSMYAPGMHFWYATVERWIPTATLFCTCRKLFLHSTLVAISSFTLTTTLEQSLAALRDKGPTMWLTALGFINIGFFVNYQFVPLPHRVTL